MKLSNPAAVAVFANLGEGENNVKLQNSSSSLDCLFNHLKEKMDGSSNSNSSSVPSSSGDAPVLDVKPLRCVAPELPAQTAVTVLPPHSAPQYILVTPVNLFAPAFSLYYPSAIPTEAQRPSEPNPQEVNGATHVEGSSFENAVQFSSTFVNASPLLSGPSNGHQGASEISDVRMRQRSSKNRHALAKDKSSKNSKRSLCSDDNCETEGNNENNEDSQKLKVSRRLRNSNDTALHLPVDGDRESVEKIILIYDGLRRRLMQIDDTKEPVRGTIKRPDLKAGAIMLNKGLRLNSMKKIGPVQGVEIGDVFFFRFEICLVGLHAPNMGGIDYMSAMFSQEDEPIAISIVSSGGYENDVDDTDVLIYSGQGGNTKDGKQTDDQRLERGNLAMERSTHRKNEIRVIRGIKDMTNPTGKIYVYDGLYKIEESWTEKAKTGKSVFKYKLLRVPGQPSGSVVWKLSHQWRENPSSRFGIILPDISSGIENLPVCLVNDVDKDKGPAHFQYFDNLKYLKPIESMRPPLGCNCQHACVPGDTECSCARRNGGYQPYTSNGILVSRRPFIYECGSSCLCAFHCQNRISQKGVRLHFEVFKTKDRGWGLRSWDPIRAGSFICEFTGEFLDSRKVKDEDEDDEYIFEATLPNEKHFDWNYIPELLEEEKPDELEEVFNPVPIVLSAKNLGNVARFMNHSCSPNVLWQPVLYDHNDECYPHIMFYALKHIPPMVELTYDYGQSEDRCGEGKKDCGIRRRRRRKCLCASSNCRGFFG